MFAITRGAIDASDLSGKVDVPSAGAVVTFEGRVRNHADGRSVQSLAYEAYEALAEKEGELILSEARARFAIERAACVHRTGHLLVGEMAVWVGVSAAHRSDGFAACRFIIDEVKLRVPIWKKEYYADGESVWVEGLAAASGRLQES